MTSSSAISRGGPIVVSDRKRSLIFINIVISCIASSMLSTALTTALPPILKDLNLSVTTGQWLTSGYSLALAIMMPLTAFLINRFSTKKLYCAAILVFNLGLLICAISSNFYIMMVGRIIQASGNGILTSMAQVIILTIYPIEKRGSAMGWYGLSVGAAPVVAPTIAGWLVDNFGWRIIFYAAFFIMLISFIYALFVFDDVLETSKKKFDTISFILSGFAFGGITLGIGNIGSYEFLSTNVLLTFGVGILATILFVYRQLHLDQPFLELRTLKNKSYSVSVLGSMMLYFIMMGSSILLPLYVQNTMGLSATISGLVAFPGSLCMTITSPFAGKIYDKVGIKALFIAGSILLIISNAFMFFIDMNTSIWLVAAFNAIRCISIGCLLMTLVTWGTSEIDSSMTSHATALLNSLRTIFGAIGSAVFVAIMTTVANNSVSTYGNNASIHGINVAYICMAGGSVILLMIAIFGCSKKTVDNN